MEREFIGQGSEHLVWRSHTTPRYVLKKPHGLNALVLPIYGDVVSLIRQELAEAREIAIDTGVVIPKTHVFPFDSLYIIAQEYIEEDCSLDINSVLNSTGIDRFKNIRNTRNYRSNQGIIYWLDPTKGPIHRFVTNTLLPEKHYSSIQAQLRELGKRTKLW